MSSSKRVDYLIVGQGLAGSCLALQLINRNKSVFVLDEPEKNKASAIAAGLFNPVTGKLMTKTWKADKLFTYLQQFYIESEKVLGTKFFYPFPLYRPFVSIEEQNEWMGKSSEPEMMQYIDQVFSSSAFPNEVNDPFGGLLLKGCGYVDVLGFIRSTRDFLILRDSFKVECFEENDLQFLDEKIEYRDILADKVIFCNGVESLKSNLFKNIPIRPLKGETLFVKIEQPVDRIYNRGVYVVPSGSGSYKVGATYNTKDRSHETTEVGRTELIEKLKDLIKLTFQEQDQDWGFRPTTPDRRPILGSHPDHPNLVMFNGLGTKGVSIAPYFSHELADWLTDKGEIDKVVDIARYY